MSRSGYSDGIDNWDLIKWRGQVASAIRGKRGQALLKDLHEALLALPEKRLITDELIDTDGDVCALGAVGKMRNVDMSQLDPSEPEEVAAAFNIAEQLAQEIVYMNDEYWDRETPEERYKLMLKWVEQKVAVAN